MVDDDSESMCMLRMLFKGSQQNALNRNFQLSQLLLSLLNHKSLHQIIEDLQLSDSDAAESDVVVTKSIHLILLAFGIFNSCATE